MISDGTMHEDARLTLTILCIVSGPVLFALRATEFSGLSAFSSENGLY